MNKMKTIAGDQKESSDLGRTISRGKKKEEKKKEMSKSRRRSQYCSLGNDNTKQMRIKRNKKNKILQLQYSKRGKKKKPL